MPLLIIIQICLSACGVSCVMCRLSEDLISASTKQQLWRVLLGSELLWLLASPYRPSEPVCPPSFITPFTVNELCSPSAVLSSPFFPPTFYRSYWNRCESPTKICSPLPTMFVSSSPFSHRSTNSSILSISVSPPLRLLVICLTLSMWQWSASKADSKLCLIGMIVHLYHHLPQKKQTHTHAHTLTHYLKPAPTCCDHNLKGFFQQND